MMAETLMKIMTLCVGQILVYIMTLNCIIDRHCIVTYVIIYVDVSLSRDKTFHMIYLLSISQQYKFSVISSKITDSMMQTSSNMRLIHDIIQLSL